MRSYMSAQKKKIELEKWYEGVRINRDPGNDFVVKWIQNHGSWFRKSWEKSLCRACLQVDQCGHNVVAQCDKFSDN